MSQKANFSTQRQQSWIVLFQLPPFGLRAGAWFLTWFFFFFFFNHNQQDEEFDQQQQKINSEWCLLFLKNFCARWNQSAVSSEWARGWVKEAWWCATQYTAVWGSLIAVLFIVIIIVQQTAAAAATGQQAGQLEKDSSLDHRHHNTQHSRSGVSFCCNVSVSVCLSVLLFLLIIAITIHNIPALVFLFALVSLSLSVCLTVAFSVILSVLLFFSQSVWLSLSLSFTV